MHSERLNEANVVVWGGARQGRMAAYSWSCATGHAAWTPRDGAQLVRLGGDLFLLGGWTTDPELLVFFSFD